MAYGHQTNKVKVWDGTDETDVELLDTKTDNIDAKKGLVTKAELYGRVSDTSSRPLALDASTYSLQTIDYAHHEIHGGSTYDYTEVKDQTENHCRDIQITTPSGGKLAHLTLDFWSEAETNWWIWEDVVITNAGTEVTPRNHRRDAGDSSILTVKYIDNDTLVLANVDTETANGGNPATLLAHGTVGAGKKVGGGAESREEWILKPSEDYLIRFEAEKAGFISYHVDWYEHTDKE